MNVESRTRDLIVGTGVIVLIFWVRFAGDIPLLPVLVSTAMPAPDPALLSADPSGYEARATFIEDRIADFLAIIGSGFVYAVCGLYRMTVGLVSRLWDWIDGDPPPKPDPVAVQAPATEALTKSYVLTKVNTGLDIVSKHVAAINARIDSTESRIRKLETSKPVAAKKTTARSQ
jgi:hypothetical protein